VNHETDRKQSKNSRLTLGFIASNLNDPRKKISETIQILDKPDMSGTQILLAGSGKIRFRTKYVDLRYLGALSGQNLLNFYQSIHALLIPSSNETFSLTTVEAALCGTPVIAPAHSAQAEIIDRFQVGLLYSNSIQLAQLSYWDSLPDLAEHTRQTLREHYKPKSIANKHLDFYRQMLAQPVN
jgi:glycosyltransferase involved in cell wall biosynthesis